MPYAPDHVVNIWRACDRIARLSDRIIKIGPLNLGLDSLLALLPIGGGLYTIAVGAVLVFLGWRAGASMGTLARMAVFVAVDAITSDLPVLGAAVDALFPGHILAARALKRDIERRYGPILEEARPRRPWGRFADRFRRPAAA